MLQTWCGMTLAALHGSTGTQSSKPADETGETKTLATLWVIIKEKAEKTSGEEQESLETQRSSRLFFPLLYGLLAVVARWLAVWSHRSSTRNSFSLVSSGFYPV